MPKIIDVAGFINAHPEHDLPDTHVIIELAAESGKGGVLALRVSRGTARELAEKLDDIEIN